VNRAEGEVERKLGAYAVFLLKRQPASARLPATPGSGAKFLVFAAEHRGYTSEQTPNIFLAALGKRTAVNPWQIRQTTEAIHIYRYQSRGMRGQVVGTDESPLIEACMRACLIPW